MSPTSRPRVVVAMSGGVDSSVAALVLRERGYDVMGVTMRLYAADASVSANHQGCCTIDDIEDARRVCQIIRAPHYVLDVRDEFRTHVIDGFVAAYASGRTPHPCIACNDRIKFDFLLHRARLWDTDFVATGHYARVDEHPETHERFLLRAADPLKDQSYVLYTLTQERLRHLLLPIGELTKAEVRATAAHAGLPVADKPDSQEICFVPGDYREFLRSRTPSVPGEFVDAGGRVIGAHPGIVHFTVGQRRGLGLATGERLFVTRIDPETRRVVLGNEHDLLHNAVRVERVTYVGARPTGPLPVTAKVRYNGRAAGAVLEPDGAQAVLRFDVPQRAATPGQAAVFYDGERLLGGGTIVGTTD